MTTEPKVSVGEYLKDFLLGWDSHPGLLPLQDVVEEVQALPGEGVGKLIGVRRVANLLVLLLEVNYGKRPLLQT